MADPEKQREPKRTRGAKKTAPQADPDRRAPGAVAINLRRLLIGIVLAAAAFFLWPRTPSLSDFDPNRMAELQVSAWKKAKARQRWDLAGGFYRIYAGQYGAFPFSSLMMAADSANAVILFQSAPDAADQEKALAPMVKVFNSLQSQTRESFDPYAAAQMEFQIWGLRANGGRQAELVRALSEQLALLYGKPADDCLPVAKKFALAMKAADGGQWADALSQNKDAWAKLKALAK